MTPRRGIIALLAMVVMLYVVQPLAVNAASGVDDYPSALKKARQDSVVDPWQFYNRECTSFVAWRLNSQNGVPFDDYYLGAHWGNASNWRNAAAAVGVPVDGTPVPGAVAWWAKGSAGSSRGHVAWVEAVSGSTIVIEEYNYLKTGGYDTRTISSSSSVWPSGFIHVETTRMRNVVPPTLIGTPQVGLPLTLRKGTWKPGKATYAYQWRANGRTIAGATSSSFAPPATQLGQRIQAVVTATKAGFKTTHAVTLNTAPVARGVFSAPAAPTVSGSPQVGLQLSATSGTWSSAATFAYRWFADGTAIPGAKASTFIPRPGQVGHALTVRVTATAPGYKTAASVSTPTGAVTPGQFTSSGAPTIAGTPQVDHPLAATPGTFTPTGTLAYQWLANGAPISGATAATYTPTASDRTKQLSVQVTVTRTGYQTAVTTSAASDPVAAGTFLNTQQPAVSGAAKVGATFTAHAGTWSPEPTITYQWLADGNPLPGATAPTYTSTATDLGRVLSVRVTADRDGYLTAVTTSPATDPLSPGDFASTARPTVTGVPVVGQVLSATDGAWTPAPELLAYQWYAGPNPVAGATSATYTPTEADAGHRMTVRVTATSIGYQPRAVSSRPTGRVLLGQTTLGDRPTIAGKTILGHTLHAHVGTITPAGAQVAYRWLRGGHAIRGARTDSYTLRPADVGRRLRVQATVRALHWTSQRQRSERSHVVRTLPVLGPSTTVQGGRVRLGLTVHAPGLGSPSGTAHVLEGKRSLGRVQVAHGHGTSLLRHLASGRHVLTVVYHGIGPQVTVRIRLVVRVP